MATIADVVEWLKDHQPAALNILLTHHHPMKLGVVNVGDQSHMVGGEVLLERLVGASSGPWMTIHGHKHIPRLDYFSSGGRALPVMAAGSLAARLWDEAADVAKNQFYVLDIQTSALPPGLDDIVCKCSAWSWSPSSGWQVSGASGGVMSGSGFGWRAQEEVYADALESALDESGQRWITRDELVTREERYEFMTTADQLRAHEKLRSRGLVVVEDDGRLLEFGRR
jgi:hypothetical protein